MLVVRLVTLVLVAAILFAQAPGPAYDPGDPEGLVVFPNGRGRSAWKRKGIWRTVPLSAPRGNGSRVPVVTPAERTAMNDTLERLVQAIRVTPTATALVGFWMLDSRSFDYPNQADLPAELTAPKMPFRFATGLFPFYLADRLVNGKFVPDWSGETESVYFEFNLLPGRFNRNVIVKETVPNARDAEFYVRPEVSGTFAGFPVYDDSDLIITRKGRDPWAAASYGRVLKAALTEYEKDRQTAENRLALLRKENEDVQSPAYEEKMRAHLEKSSGEFRSTNPNKWQGRVAGMERELKYNREVAALKANPRRDKDGWWYWNPIDAHETAARKLAEMTPELAARSACFLRAMSLEGRYAIQGTILTSGANPQCKDLVSDNFRYFDSSLPRSAPQLLLVRSFGRCATFVNGKAIKRNEGRKDYPPQGCQQHFPIWQELDWDKVAALLVP